MTKPTEPARADFSLRKALRSIPKTARAVLVVLSLAACAARLPVDSTWRATESAATRVTLLQDGTARLVNLDRLAISPECDLNMPSGDVVGSWERKSNGTYLITYPSGEVEWRFDYWFGEPNFEKAYIQPCEGGEVWYFAREF